ncbi:putative CAAX prenyl protease 2 [Leishmania braziliensis MHOM/BR/75/M2904]|uniref:intramembrane prenyl-peptidase Rce1 n=2 Tax=Leishmania braziliensis TaxID=5660 RepID=A4HFB3_LEIBR|nr:putative CAAX prenyl protease 2 [Leishmania braziliensis MHOM/BR/75/M2904]CAJ2473487.1 unnamed protein product [Leishmania braziliensis]CAJ2474983.1 unnamed protein product [Leishmania braziliensis]CAM39524.1 putative CAAX prenyl protease 2 [Leishmania braziliensis MHOM/BR/75/M2904]SYZ66165.1 CAAX_prenyl_protease_2 [Leishmania braziliensis MHOM/BR/75/M2904]SYZ66930.1 CAAX_prenyl_protease_2 [Leishmania braziliensis MHOM/BR/75/M2904]
MDLLLCAGASAAFISTFYVWPRERRFISSSINSLGGASLDPTVYVDRNSDEAIRRRTISLGFSCVVSGVYLAFGTASSFTLERQSTWLRPVIRSLLSTLLLFAGPIAEMCYLRTFEAPDRALQLWRNYVICPMGEELFYRGVLFSLLHRRSSAVRIGVSAILFALSHIHHLVSLASDAYRRCEDNETDRKDLDGRERACWRSAGRTICGVFVFTTLFGLLGGYYYEHVCEGSIIAIAAAHALCNIIGPPELTVLRGSQFTAFEKAASATLYVAGVVGWAWTLLLH